MRRVAVAVALACGAGCALTAPVPGGALRQSAFLQVQPTWALAYGPATALIHPVSATTGGGAVTISGNAQNLAGDQTLAAFGAVIPVSAAVRQSIGRAVDVAVDGGFMNSGVELRAGAPDREASAPWALSASARSGRFGLVGVGRDSYELRGRLEVYPRLRPEDPSSARFVLAGGVAYGNFVHDLALPRDPNFFPGDVPSAPPHIAMLRPELRLELVLGFQHRTPHAAVMVALAPWFVLSSGAARSLNSDWIVDGYDQTFGMSLLFSIGGGSDLAGRDPASPALSR